MDGRLLRPSQPAAVESHRRMNPFCAPGCARRSSRGIAQSLRSGVSPKAERVLYKKALRAVSNHSGGLAPTASGANSVASALGTSPGATPAKL